MSKKAQLEANKEVLEALDRFKDELKNCTFSTCNRLRACNAYVYESPSFYVLRSYNTVVAIIEKSTGTCYDFLRLVYGYTSTSAQHISKFNNDYGSKWDCNKRFTYREV